MRLNKLKIVNRLFKSSKFKYNIKKLSDNLSVQTNTETNTQRDVKRFTTRTRRKIMRSLIFQFLMVNIIQIIIIN